MALKLTYYGQNDGTVVPDVVLTGDPGTDQADAYRGRLPWAEKSWRPAFPVPCDWFIAATPCDADTACDSFRNSYQWTRRICRSYRTFWF
jgi:hypothetical protein